MLNHKIRKAVPADIPRIKEIRFAVKENRLLDPARVTDQDIIWFIENAPVWVWEKNSIIHGFSAGDPRDGSIWALFVDPAAEKQGIGSALIKACCENLHAAGHKIVKLTTDPASRAAEFYRRKGWVEQGGNGKGEIVFSKNLTKK